MSAGNAGGRWRPFRLRMASETVSVVESTPARSEGDSTSPGAALGTAPTLVPTPRPVPAKLVAVVLRFDSGATIEYPMDRPMTLTRPPSRIDLIGGKSYLDERQ